MTEYVIKLQKYGMRLPSSSIYALTHPGNNDKQIAEPNNGKPFWSSKVSKHLTDSECTKREKENDNYINIYPRDCKCGYHVSSKHMTISFNVYFQCRLLNNGPELDIWLSTRCYSAWTERDRRRKWYRSRGAPRYWKQKKKWNYFKIRNTIKNQYGSILQHLTIEWRVL